MLCEKCQKNQATVHLQQIVNGEKAELHLCQECSLPAEMPISFETLIHGFLGSLLSMTADRPDSAVTQKPEVTCSRCGLTYDGFKSSGKLGCAECYQTFSNELEALLKNVQGSIRHEGKFPRKSGRAMLQKRETDRLRLRLTKAIEEENYEEAAHLRDLIRGMEAVE